MADKKTTLAVLGLLFFTLNAMPAMLTSPLSPGDTREAPLPLPLLSVSHDLYGANITDLSLTPGNTISVEVNITNAGPMNGFDITLDYDTIGPGVLDATSVALSGLFGTDPEGCTIFTLKQDVDLPQGKIRVAAAILGGCSVEGTGTLFVVNFDIKTIGATMIDIIPTDNSGRYLTLLANSGVAVQYESQGAYFRNKAGIPPIAEFTYTPSQPVLGESVAFDGSGSFDPNNSTVADRGIRKYSWDFGDGTMRAEGEFPNHVFIAPPNRPISGNFTVRLIVSDYADGLVNGKLAIVDVGPGPTTPDFGLTPSQNSLTLLQGSVQIVTITAYSINSFVGNISLTASVNPNILGSPQVTLFPSVVLVAPAYVGVSSLYVSAANFTLPGFYNVTVTGTSGSLSHTVTVDVEVVESTNMFPIASFTFSPTNPEVGTSVFFDGSYSYDPDGYIASWSWDFGDGFSSFGIYAYHTYYTAGNYTATLAVTDNLNALAITSKTVNVLPSTNQAPTAMFFFNPQNPVTGQTVYFDGSSSFDPDGSIVDYRWDFGEGFVISDGPFVSHTYYYSGNFTVTLMVRDNDGATGTANAIINVRPRPIHDVAVAAIYVQPATAVSSQFVNMQVVVFNKGVSQENVTLTVFYDGNIIETRVVLVGTYYYQYFNFVWDTLGVSPDVYIISATAALAGDEFPGDNTLADGTVTILPGPTLTLTPDNGALGAKIQVTGSGFPAPTYGPSLTIVTISFDDQFQGYIITRQGQFVFVFNLPHAEPGEHIVKAMDIITGARASARFTVLPGGEIGGPVFELSVDVGTIYFPSEIAVIYLTTSQDGILVGPTGVQLEVVLIAPDGTRTPLTANSMGTGVYKATFTVPRTAAVGTYAVLAQATMNDMNASALRSFEVKPSWITTQGPRIASVTAAVFGVAAVAVFAWRRGYLKRREDTLPFF